MTNELVKFCAEKGVPMPETCEKLNWQGETNFIWVKDGSGYKLHSKSEYLIEYLLNEANQQREDFDKWREIEENCKAVNGRLAQGKLSMVTEILTILGKDTSSIYVQDYSEIDGIPAPQMQEIAPLLPPKIWFITNEIEFFHYNNYIGYDTYNQIFEVLINDHHYAQAYAELYIKLREEGITS
jgi:hypothetical protein